MGRVKRFIFGDDIREGKMIYKDAVKMAWPSILESFLLAMTNFVDTIMVSSVGVAAIAAVGLTTQPKFIALAIFMSLGVAISSIVARRRGEGDKESANKVLKMALIFGVALSVVSALVFFIFADPIIRLCGSEPDTHADSVQYLRIIMLGLPFNVTTIFVNAAQRGSGNTRISMITNITANVVNVIFNYLLIGGKFGFPALGVSGAALATTIGGAVACVMSIMSIFHADGFIYIKSVKGYFANKKDIKAIFNVGTSAFIEQICLRVGFLLFALTVASLGTLEFAANQIGMSFMNLSFAFADGLAIASVALVGRSLGQKRPDMAKKYTSACQKLGFVCALIISSIYTIWGRNLFMLFESENQVVLDYGDMLMKILSVVLFAQIFQVTTIGALRGAGDTKYTAFISLISVTLIRPLSSWLLCYPLGLGLAGVWLGLCTDQLIRTIMGYSRFKKGEWLKIKI